MGLTEDGAYVGIITGSVKAGAEFAVGVFPFAALRQDGIVTTLETPIQSQQAAPARVLRAAVSGGGDGFFGIGTPGIDKLGLNVQLQMDGGDIDYVVTGEARFRFNAVWTKSLD
jgi:hypothetical protein